MSLFARDPFARADPTDDKTFYAVPRRVVHIEAGAIEALRRAYAGLLRPGEPVLDLMSSWRSHLPEGLGPVTGLGMNAEEMEDNPQLDGWVVQDLNEDPRLPFAAAAFGAVVCTVSVQYLIRPAEVFAEVLRVLRPGGAVGVAFSNRCFPTKAVAQWLGGSDDDHRELIGRLLRGAGFAQVRDEELPSPDDPVWLVAGRKPTGGLSA